MFKIHFSYVKHYSFAKFKVLRYLKQEPILL
jgi:hypothetical protein